MPSTSQKRTVANPAVCYLCGETLTKPISSDHVPLKGLVAPEIRKTHNLNLLTIRSHESCNEAYSFDEEYFVATIMPFAMGSEAGDAIYRKHLADYRAGSRTKLMEKVRREFETRPGGLYLPRGKVAKRIEGDRFARVAFKIVRGLYFHHHSKALPSSLSVSVELTAPGERPPDHFIAVKDLPDDVTHGRYPGIFDYRFRCFDVDDGKLNYWAMLFWDRVIVTVAFHDPWFCTCEGCQAALAFPNSAPDPIA